MVKISSKKLKDFDFFFLHSVRLLKKIQNAKIIIRRRRETFFSRAAKFHNIEDLKYTQKHVN